MARFPEHAYYGSFCEHVTNFFGVHGSGLNTDCGFQTLCCATGCMWRVRAVLMCRNA
jgi:hypothetical protein